MNVATQRVAEPSGLRDSDFQSAFAEISELLNSFESINDLLVDPEPDGQAWADKRAFDFYSAGSENLGLDTLRMDRLLVYDKRPDESDEHLLRDWISARLVEALRLERDADEAADTDEALRARKAQRYLAYHLVCAMRFGMGLGHLVQQAVAGDDEAVCRLLEFDKSAVGIPALGRRMNEAQGTGDWEFLKRVGHAMSKKPLEGEPNLFRVEIMASIFWDWKLKEMSYAKIHALLADHGMLHASTDPQTLRKWLNRAGFKKIPRK